MADRFREFFIGLSESAPVVAQLVHDYTIWQYNQGMAERKMALEEDIGRANIQQSKDIGKYYTNQADIATSKEEREKKLDDALFQITVDRETAAEETATRARDLQKFNTNVAIQPYNSLTP